MEVSLDVANHDALTCGERSNSASWSGEHKGQLGLQRDSTRAANPEHRMNKSYACDFYFLHRKITNSQTALHDKVPVCDGDFAGFEQGSLLLGVGVVVVLPDAIAAGEQANIDLFATRRNNGNRGCGRSGDSRAVQVARANAGCS